MQCELLAAAATSPAHRVPCLKTKRRLFHTNNTVKQLDGCIAKLKSWKVSVTSSLLKCVLYAEQVNKVQGDFALTFRTEMTEIIRDERKRKTSRYCATCQLKAHSPVGVKNKYTIRERMCVMLIAVYTFSQLNGNWIQSNCRLWT